jgi:GntR family transcriptional regulator/MocR family aminotransferase
MDLDGKSSSFDKISRSSHAGPMELELSGAGPLYRRLAQALREAIRTGRLSPGEALPSSRALAADLGLSRNTVVLAYHSLEAEGFLATRAASRTYVAEGVGPPRAVARLRTFRPAPAEPTAETLRALALRPVSWGYPRKALRWDFRFGEPSYADFPHANWRRLLARHASGRTTRHFDYGPPEGVPELRAAIARYLARARGLDVGAEHILIVSGSQQGFDLVARSFLAPGTSAAVEDPGYRGAEMAFRLAGARPCAVPVDAQGLNVEALARLDPAPRLVCATPAHQFPTGAAMPLSRRLRLLDWARRAEAIVVEDDYDSEYRYDSAPLPPLKSLDEDGRVVLVGTFSKLLFPALRIGYIVAEPPLLASLAAVKALADTGNPLLEQRTLADFIAEGAYERHLRRSRRHNALRRAALLDALAEHLSAPHRLSGAAAGLHVLLTLEGVASEQVAPIRRAAEAVGVGVYSALPFHRRRPREAQLILGYASLEAPTIREGVRRLAGVLAGP